MWAHRYSLVCRVNTSSRSASEMAFIQRVYIQGFSSVRFLKISKQTIQQTRVTGERDELLKDVSGHHPRLLPEHGVQLRLSLVVAQEVSQLLGHDGRLVLPRQLTIWGLQNVGLSQTQGGLESCLCLT